MYVLKYSRPLNNLLIFSSKNMDYCIVPWVVSSICISPQGSTMLQSFFEKELNLIL